MLPASGARELLASAPGGQAGEAQLAVGHAQGEVVRKFGSCRRVEVAEGDDHVAELGIDAQLPVLAGRAAPVRPAAQRPLPLHAEAVPVLLLLVWAGRSASVAVEINLPERNASANRSRSPTVE
jgi:hypothetical protein